MHIFENSKQYNKIEDGISYGGNLKKITGIEAIEFIRGNLVISFGTHQKSVILDIQPKREAWILEDRFGNVIENSIDEKFINT